MAEDMREEIARRLQAAFDPMGWDDAFNVAGFVQRAVMAERARCASIATRIEAKQDADHGDANTGGAAEVYHAIRAEGEGAGV